MQERTEDIIPVERAGTLAGLFQERLRRTPHHPAYRYFDKQTETWRALDWAAMGAQVARWCAALAREALRPGERVAVQLRNGAEWVAFDLAAHYLGLVVVPLYTEDRPENVVHILTDAQCRLLLMSSATHWRRLAPALSRLEHLQRVVLLDAEDAEDVGSLDTRSIAAGAWLPARADLPAPYPADPRDLATIVYTSGTTGRPKGVMLSHRNMLSVAHAGLTMIDVYQDDLFLSFLPLSHMLERTAGYYLPIMAGACVAYARSIGQLAEDLQAVRPTLLIAVPRIFERVYGRIQEQMGQAPWYRRALFALAVQVGWQVFLQQQGRRANALLVPLWPALQKLVASKVVEKLGGRLRAAVSGGAALPFPVAQLFIGLGVPILQGYGLTETSPVLSVNLPDDNEPASVGVPLRGTELRIGENAELLARGPGVMLGYWNNHTATAQMIDADGWLHTGDQAHIERGHVYITGRIKDILVLSNSEKVPPGDMEAAICLDPLIDQALVVGEGRAYLGALLVLNAEHWFGLARQFGIDPYAPESLDDARLHAKILKQVRHALHAFPGYAKIRRVALFLDDWTVENGLQTPTLKLKRLAVLERFGDVVEGLYR
ncbi:MAG: long-chain fatty acid--CoA ligase [Gammaproteobacteria bacterium]|nr:long-chain fatty acid--CoA ligase [Gammaproteobacteria bacterium]